MRHIRRYFALLFIAVTLLSALHEVIHNHHHEFTQVESDESCYLYTYAQTPTLLATSPSLESIEIKFEPFQFPKQRSNFTLSIPTQSRSPPLS